MKMLKLLKSSVVRKQKNKWSPLLMLGAIDCANRVNTPLCRHYGIVATPTLKYFGPHFGDDEGTGVSGLTVEKLRKDITLELLKRPDLPELQPFRGSVSKLWTLGKPQSQYVVLVIECSHMIGPQLVLDYWNAKKVTVVPLNCKNSLLKNLSVEYSINNVVFVVGKNLSSKAEAKGAEESEITRSEALTELYEYFKNKGIVVPQAFNLLSIKGVSDDLENSYDNMKTRKPYKHTGEVFRVDIEGALLHTLTMEIPVHKLIRGDALTALKNYLDVLHKYFPIGKDGEKFLGCVHLGVQEKDPAEGITGEAFVDNVENCQTRHNPKYLEPDNGWVGCHGTLPMYRGVPCSVWTMFHTLTVQAYHKGAIDPQEVLRGMNGYIANFFGCSDCANHFTAMASSMESDVKSLEDSVLWLWAAHNKVNKRLADDATEDPNFPKVQFPPSEICKSCHLAGKNFNKTEVLNFLHHMYTNIKDVTPTQLDFNTTYAGQRSHKVGKSVFN